ncbi:MAG: lytic murein transglycosylase [Proteobacteria bacterium]|nr:lytic murein transglycosylase [Pseudomonadota bacterium]
MVRVQKHPLYFFTLFFLVFLIIPATVFSEPAIQENGVNHFTTLKQKLVSDGFDKKSIDALYTSPEILFDSEGTGLFFIHNEGLLNYEPFANKTSIHRARKYIETHHDYFERIEKNFGVDKTVITAIILVETGLGTYMGKRRVINTLSTMASLSDPAVREVLWTSLDKDKRLERARFDKKADNKSTWAYGELKAFIRYADREKLDTCSVNGSYAGAMGIAQFMPSNILFLAKDGNSDGAIDMFNHKDAIASIANYLRHYGWHSEINHEKAQEVLYAYNHSGYYVTILMKISRLLKGENG